MSEKVKICYTCARWRPLESNLVNPLNRGKCRLHGYVCLDDHTCKNWVEWSGKH